MKTSIKTQKTLSGYTIAIQLDGKTVINIRKNNCNTCFFVLYTFENVTELSRYDCNVSSMIDSMKRFSDVVLKGVTENRKNRIFEQVASMLW